MKPMDEDMRDSGKTVKGMGKELPMRLMETNLKGNTRMIRKMVGGHIIGKLDTSLKGSSRIV